MLIAYIQAAMGRAKYELLAGKEGFIGRIPGFRGLIGHARTLEACRDDLHGALQSWLLIKLRHGDRDIPVIKGMNLASTGGERKTNQKHSSSRAA
jgi:predicted RNase H-like HicB family nuclease